jgi:hypothetical protein
MARTRNPRGILIVTTASVAVLALVAAKWLLPAGDAAGGDPSAQTPVAAAPAVDDPPPASQPATDPTSVRVASRVYRPLTAEPAPAPVTPVTPAKPNVWLDSVLSGSKTPDSSVLGVPTAIDLSAPSAPISSDPSTTFGPK